MDYLFNAHIQRNKDKRNAKVYEIVRKEKLGNVERNIFVKEFKHPSTVLNGQYQPPYVEKREYVKHNGKYVQLSNYKKMMNIVSRPNSPKQVAKDVSSNVCKKDCAKVGKVCNKDTKRCNKVKKVVTTGDKQCKKDCVAIKKVCNQTTGRCNKSW